MTKKRHSIDRKVPKYETSKLIAVKKYRFDVLRPSCSLHCDNSLDRRDSRSNSAQRRSPLQEKCLKKPRSGTKKQKTSVQKRRTVSVPPRGTVPITPQMIRVAVKELQTRRVYISSGLIASHLKRLYPIENNPDALKDELKEKLNCAVSVGLIAKCGDDKYCIPTLRQEATLNRTAFTAFWDTYYAKGSPSMMEEFVKLGIPRLRGYKNQRETATRHSCDSNLENNQNLHGLESV